MLWCPLDVNECEFARSKASLQPNDPCLHKCENFPGFFKCSCNDGYQLRENQCEGVKGELMEGNFKVSGPYSKVRPANFKIFFSRAPD